MFIATWKQNCSSQQGSDGKVGAGAMRGSNQAPKSYHSAEVVGGYPNKNNTLGGSSQLVSG